MNFPYGFNMNYTDQTPTNPQTKPFDGTMMQNNGMGCCGNMPKPVAQPSGCCQYLGCCPSNEVCCNQVMNKCYVIDYPQVINYHTHVVNTMVQRHITIPKYTTSEETIYQNEFLNGQTSPTNPSGFNSPFGY